MITEKARPGDMEEILSIYAGARKFMAERGNPNQWTNGYPLRADLEQDMRCGSLYVCRTGRIEAVFKFITEPDPTYGIITGAWLSSGPYGTLHRVASAGNISGIFDSIVSWASDRCSSLRADTHRDNTVMQRALKRCGFEYCGIIFLENGDERLAYEKIIK